MGAYLETWRLSEPGTWRVAAAAGHCTRPRCAKAIRSACGVPGLLAVCQQRVRLLTERAPTLETSGKHTAALTTAAGCVRWPTGRILGIVDKHTRQLVQGIGKHRSHRFSLTLACVVLAGLNAGGGIPLAHADPAAGAAYDPDTCISGYVWREAYDGDHVCVTPDVRAAAVADNAAADSRFARNFLPYGPDTCIVGYVWRSANAADHVCVRPLCGSRSLPTTPRHPLASTPTAPPVRTPVWSATSGARPMTAMMSA